MQISKYTIVLYTKENGESPVKRFIDALETKMQAKVLRFIGKDRKISMRDDLDKLLDEYMEDPEFKKEWDDLESEFNMIQALVDARKSRNMTQKQLAQRTGIDQGDISKIENGNGNPTLNILKRLADGMDMILKLEFVPKAK